MHKESVFSFKLLKLYLDCYSPMCELITLAVSLDRSKNTTYMYEDREVME